MAVDPTRSHRNFPLLPLRLIVCTHPTRRPHRSTMKSSVQSISSSPAIFAVDGRRWPTRQPNPPRQPKLPNHTSDVTRLVLLPPPTRAATPRSRRKQHQPRPPSPRPRKPRHKSRRPSQGQIRPPPIALPQQAPSRSATRKSAGPRDQRLPPRRAHRPVGPDSVDALKRFQTDQSLMPAAKSIRSL